MNDVEEKIHEQGRPMSSSGSSIEFVEEIQRPVRHLRRQLCLDEWVEDPCRAWLRGERIHDLSRELAERVVDGGLLDQGWIDGFVERVTGAMSAVQVSGMKNKRPRSVLLPKGRAGKKRKVYATTQELYRRCPERFAELVRKDCLAGLRVNLDLY
jgi:hypothetical protein